MLKANFDMKTLRKLNLSLTKNQNRQQNIILLNLHSVLHRMHAGAKHFYIELIIILSKLLAN